MRQTSLVIFCLALSLFTQVAVANEEPDIEVPQGKTLLNVQRFNSAKFGTVNVILRSDGEVPMRPYAADIRLNCAKGANKNWKKLRNARMQTACELEKENIKYDAVDDVVILRYLDVDAEDYNRQSKEPSIKSPVLKCKKRPTTLRISVEDLCAKMASWVPLATPVASPAASPPTSPVAK